jgi:hypothetical protein
LKAVIEVPLSANPEQALVLMLGSRRVDFARISRKFPSDPRLFSLKTKKYLYRHPVDCWLKYTNSMKIGQPKLSERVKGVGGSLHVKFIDKYRIQGFESMG